MSLDSAPERRWNRLLLVCLLFLLYEGALIIALGDYFYTGVSSELGARMMIAAAALGYLLLGALAGSPLSALALPLPVLVAFTADPPIPPDAWGGEPLPLYVIWALLSIFFLPAWFLGFVIDLIRRGARTRKAPER